MAQRKLPSSYCPPPSTVSRARLKATSSGTSRQDSEAKVHRVLAMHCASSCLEELFGEGKLRALHGSTIFLGYHMGIHGCSNHFGCQEFFCCFVCEFSDGQRYTPGFGQIDLLVLRYLVMFGVVWVKLGNLLGV